MQKSKKLFIAVNIISVFIIICLVNAFSTDSASAAYSNYGSGDYGRCAYSYGGSSCSISITNNNANGFFLVLNITPTISGSCTIQSDQVGVSTYDPNGYTLTLADQTTNTNLVYDVNSIPTSSGTPASPVTLTNNWGYRIDSYSGFGSGPTSGVTNSGPSSLTFAGIQSSGSTPDTIASTSSYNSSAINTTVWYGICLDTTSTYPEGLYATNVIYSAVAN